MSTVFLSETITFLPLHAPNIQWGHSNRVTAGNIPVQKEGRWQAQRSLYNSEIMWANIESPFILLQGLGIIRPDSQLNVLGSWFWLLIHPLFFMKESPRLQPSSFLSTCCQWAFEGPKASFHFLISLSLLVQGGNVSNYILLLKMLLVFCESYWGPLY